jgi:hypothetical protein
MKDHIAVREYTVERLETRARGGLKRVKQEKVRAKTPERAIAVYLRAEGEAQSAWHLTGPSSSYDARAVGPNDAVLLVW